MFDSHQNPEMLDSHQISLDIYDNNVKNTTSNDNYKKFNDFIFSDDLKCTGKLLHRFQHFLNIKDIPGDIVEIGSFKGSGLATFLKFLKIYTPGSNKKVISFDLFGQDIQETLSKDGQFDKDKMLTVLDRIDSSELSIEAVSEKLDGTSLNNYILVPGDVVDSIPKFLENNTGLRISMLYIDVDLDRPTYYALKYLWSRVTIGGVVIFDEYGYHKFSESNGVDRFFKEIDIVPELKCTGFSAPTAYIYKKNY